jgi:hypothetical protein
LQQLKLDDDVKRAKFCADMMEKISVEDGFLCNVVFSDEVVFHLSEIAKCADMGPEKPSRNDRACQGLSRGECVPFPIREQGVSALHFLGTDHYRHYIP